MFERASTYNFSIDKTAIRDFFDCVKNNKHDQLRTYFRDSRYKVWTLKEEDDYTALHRAVYNDSIETVNLIIEELKRRLGFDSSNVLEKYINEQTTEGLTALHYAAFRGNIEIAKILFAQGASVDIYSNRGKNVMHMSAEGNHPSIMIYLKEYHSQDVFSIDEYGSTPLHWACYAGAEEAVMLLLSLNVDINRQDKEGFTPLHLAVLGNRDTIVLRLLQNGASKTVETYKNELPLQIARNKNYKNLVSLLEDKNFNKLCTLESPVEYIPPDDSYRNLAFLIVFPELVIIFLILPYLEGDSHTIINMSLFGIGIIFYIFLIFKNPGEMKNEDLLKEPELKDKPLKYLVDHGKNIMDYCPKCYIVKSSNIKHCFLCDKCIDGWSHHCFWINKCIGKHNMVIYFLSILLSLIYAYHSILISSLSFSNSIPSPSPKVFPKILFPSDNNTYRVLSASFVFVFNILLSFPLLMLLMIQICKQANFFAVPKKGNEDLNDNKPNMPTEIELKDGNSSKMDLLIGNNFDEKDDNKDGYDNHIGNGMAINDDENDNNEQIYNNQREYQNNNNNQDKDEEIVFKKKQTNLTEHNAANDIVEEEDDENIIGNEEEDQQQQYDEENQQEQPEEQQEEEQNEDNQNQ